MNFQNNGIFGFDVSFYQRIAAHDGLPAREIDFNRMKNYGAKFVVIKAGQQNYTDEGFNYNWEHAKLAGLPRSTYWFEDKDADPKAQARYYWNLVKNDRAEGFYAMDFESGSHTDLNSAYAFLNEFQQLSQLPDDRIAIYTGYPFWNAATNNASRGWFARFPLWLAWYISNPANVLIPYPWKEVFMWQDSTPSIGINAGVQSREIDHDLFNGDEIKFKNYFGESTGGSPMSEITYTGTVKSTVTSGAIVRNAPNGTDTGQRLLANTTFEAIGAITQAGNYSWMNIVTPVSGWVATTLLDYNSVPSQATHKLEVFVDGILKYTENF
jgi:GH25 family lysozyme M1 (1,4-beta-N-acetylmuramidase)